MEQTVGFNVIENNAISWYGFVQRPLDLADLNIFYDRDLKKVTIYYNRGQSVTFELNKGHSGELEQEGGWSQ